MKFDNLLQERPAPPKRRRWPWVAALAAVALAAAAFVVVGRPARPAQIDPASPVPVGRIVFVHGEIQIFRSGEPAPAALPIAPGAGLDPYDPVLSPQGDRIVFGTLGDDNLYVVDADGSNLVQLTNERDNYAPAWSPDGRQIVFTSWITDATEPLDDEEAGFYVVNADGSDLRRLPIPADFVGTQAAWSPDGQTLAYTFYPQGSSSGNEVVNTDIAVINLDGSGFLRLNIDLTGETSPAWSPDGSTIAYVVAREYFAEDEEIWTIAADGSNRRRLTDNDTEDTAPAWSPDGRHLVFERGKNGTRLFVMLADGSEQRFLTAGFSPSWAR
ncbi:MAG TPA: hypothetical protein VD886_06880 [Herpetosiphonaceae bacterium]|nr:hypothetical protein [Herpetosiphonaceae bacterium]